jgi:hypothetical protein
MPVLSARHRLGMLDQAAQIRRQIVAAADDAHLDPGGVELGEILLDEALEQAHQEGDSACGRRQFSVEKL